MRGSSANENAGSVRRKTESGAKQNAVAFTRIGTDFLLDPLDEDAELAEEPNLQYRYSEYFGVQDSGPEEENNNMHESEEV